MADRIDVEDLAQNLTHYVRAAEHGASFIVTEQGQDVMRLVPPGTSTDSARRLAQEREAPLPTAPANDIA